MSDNIPPDLIPNILSKLPIADVLRSTSVCKSWYNLITSPFFISLHLNSSISNTESRVLIGLRSCDNMNRLDRYYLHRDNQAFEEIEELEPRQNDLVIYGPSNGVFCCFGRTGKKLMLWNPSLRKTMILPRPRDVYQRFNVGFGYLPLTNNFKIVRVIYIENSYGKFNVPPEVEIYELCTGSWRNLNAAELSYVLEFDKAQALLNGIVHWTAFHPHRDGRVIVSFDLTSEKFKTLMFPKCMQNADLYSSVVSTVKEYLCLHVDALSYYESCVFIMKEYGVTESWEKLIKFNSRDFRYLYVRENYEILGQDKGNLVSCDPKTNEIIDLGVHEDAGVFFNTHA